MVNNDRVLSPEQEMETAKFGLESFTEALRQAEKESLGLLSDSDKKRVSPKARRSKRMQWEVPLTVSTYSQNKIPVVVQAKTLVVNAHGALLAIPLDVSVGQALHLVNKQTQQEIEAHARRIVVQYPNGTKHVGVEFVTMSPDFWRHPSPPADWNPAWVSPLERNQALGGHKKGLSAKERAALEEARKIAFSRQPAPRTPVRASDVSTKTAETQRAFTPPWRLALLTAVVTVLFIAFVALRKSSSGAATNVSSASAAVSAAPAGVAAEDALLIPGVSNFRVATLGDFDPATVAWLRDSGQLVTGAISGFYSGSDRSSAYILVGGTISAPNTTVGACPDGITNSGGSYTATSAYTLPAYPLPWNCSGTPCYPSPLPSTTKQDVSTACSTVSGCTSKGTATIYDNGKSTTANVYSLAPGTYGNLEVDNADVLHMSAAPTMSTASILPRTDRSSLIPARWC